MPENADTEARVHPRGEIGDRPLEQSAAPSGQDGARHVIEGRRLLSLGREERSVPRAQTEQMTLLALDRPPRDPAHLQLPASGDRDGPDAHGDLVLPVEIPVRADPLDRDLKGAIGRSAEQSLELLEGPGHRGLRSGDFLLERRDRRDGQPVDAFRARRSSLPRDRDDGCLCTLNESPRALLGEGIAALTERLGPLEEDRPREARDGLALLERQLLGPRRSTRRNAHGMEKH